VELLELAGFIAGRVRAGRAERGWTLDEMAERSGVSRRMLVSIEQGATNPSIATLLRISDALGVGLPTLVDIGQPAALRVTRAGQAPVLWHGSTGGQAALVAATDPPDIVELWEWTLTPGEAHSSDTHTDGTRELLLVLTGHVELRVGPQTRMLSAGDSAAFRGDAPHGYANPAAASVPASFVLTVFQPRPGAGGAP